MTVSGGTLTRDETEQRYTSLLEDFHALQQITEGHAIVVHERLGRIRSGMLALYETHNVQPMATSLRSDVHRN